MPHYSYSKSSFDTVLTPDCDPQPCASGGRCLRRFGDLRKMTPPDLLSMYIVNLVIFCQFEPPLDFFSKSGQSDQMTMPTRRASKFSAKRRALLPEVFFQSLNSQAIPGFCEPWSECQPGETGPQGLGEPPGGALGEPPGPAYIKAFLIRESTNPFRQAWLGNMLIHKWTP